MSQFLEIKQNHIKPNSKIQIICILSLIKNFKNTLYNFLCPTLNSQLKYKQLKTFPNKSNTHINPICNVN